MIASPHDSEESADFGMALREVKGSRQVSDLPFYAAKRYILRYGIW